MPNCPHCGGRTAPGDGKCIHCGADLTTGPSFPGGPVPPNAQPTQRPASALTEAILVTVCCCLPFGIVSIVKAAQANGLADAGEYEGAQRLTRDAHSWALWGLFSGIALVVLRLAVEFSR